MTVSPYSAEDVFATVPGAGMACSLLTKKIRCAMRKRSFAMDTVNSISRRSIVSGYYLMTDMTVHSLVADDDDISRLLLVNALGKMGHQVLSASNGGEAWAILQEKRVDLLLTDWRMPVMDGLELCRKIRSENLKHYVYVSLMTATNEADAMLEGMAAGADDFITKPVNAAQLEARLKAAERIIRLQKDLEERNRKLRDYNAKLGQAYSVIKRDLKAGAKIQASLMPATPSIICGINFDSIFLPSSFVAGDVFSYFRLDEQYVGFYVIDVAGHGIPAAMLSVTLSKALSPTNHQECILKQFMPVPDPPFYRIINPALAVRSLNERFRADDDTMQYFTMVYGLIDTRTRQAVFTQAGHPPPVYLPKGGKPKLIGEGGFPVGMLPDADYDENEILFEKGDRLFVYSDGITECTNPDKAQFSVERLMELLEMGRDLPLGDLMESIKKSLRQWRGHNDFEDDITLLAMEVG
jgi:sigma-B regulation protein RsbU (phosphoserine phosphatase)